MHEALSEVLVLLTLILIFSISTNTFSTIILNVNKAYSHIVLKLISNYLENSIKYCYLEKLLYHRSMECILILPSEVRIENKNDTTIIVYFKYTYDVISFDFNVYAKAKGPIVKLKVDSNGRVMISD